MADFERIYVRERQNPSDGDLKRTLLVIWAALVSLSARFGFLIATLELTADPA